MASRKADPKPRDATKAETREALIQSATVLFARQGITAPSLDAICDDAGFTRGAFYVHFKDREELVAAVMERTLEVFVTAMLAGEGADSEVTTVVRRFAHAVGEGVFPFSRHGGLKSHQMMEACEHSARVRQRYLEVWTSSRQRLAAVVAASQERGLVRKDLPPQQTAALLIAAVLGFQQLLEVGAPTDVPGSVDVILGLLRPA